MPSSDALLDTATVALSDADRREYFRISDTVALQIDLVRDATKPVTPPPELAPGHQLLRELQLIDHDSTVLLRSIQDKSRDIGQYFKLINRKIELTARFYVLQQAALHYQTQEVMLSGSGLGFRFDRALPLASLVDLHFILLHDVMAISCRARITRCESGPNVFYLGSEFTEIGDSDRDAIVRHTLHVEAARRRESNDGS